MPRELHQEGNTRDVCASNSRYDLWPRRWRRTRPRRGCMPWRPCAISPASVQIKSEVCSAPDDHLHASPNCRVRHSFFGRIGGAGGSPAISAGIVSPASVNNAVAVKSAPVNHLTVGPNCRVTPARIGRISDAGGCPGISAGIVSPASLRNVSCRHIRPSRSSHCRSKLPCGLLAQRAHWWCWWVSNCPWQGCISRQY